MILFGTGKLEVYWTNYFELLHINTFSGIAYVAGKWRFFSVAKII